MVSLFICLPLEFFVPLEFTVFVGVFSYGLFILEEITKLGGGGLITFFPFSKFIIYRALPVFYFVISDYDPLCLCSSYFLVHEMMK